MLKSKKTILEAIFCTLMALCLTLGVMSAMPKPEKAYASEISIISDVLPDNFLSGGYKWENENGLSVAYVYDGKLFIQAKNYMSPVINDLSITSMLTKSGNNYTTDSSNGKITFVMDSDVLISIIITDSTEPTFNGTYLKPLPKENDTFNVDEIEYVVTFVGDTNTVKVGENKNFAGTSVTIPGAITYKDVTFDVTEIGISAFEDCKNIVSVVLSDGIKKIDESAFECCDGLTSVTIPSSVTKLGKWAFDTCENLTTVICNAVNPPELGKGVFYDKKLSVIYVPKSSVQAYKTAWTDYANKIESIVTLADILPKNFPKTEIYGWESNNGHKIYINGDDIVIDDDISLSTVVRKDGNNYFFDRYDDSFMPFTVNYKFNITSGVLKSIIVSGSFVGEFDGEYFPVNSNVNAGLSSGAIVGISVGSVAGACLIAYVAMFIVWKKNGKGLKFLFKSFEWINKIFKK